MATYKTPGVYIEEVSTFPPSVAEVSTAVPAFLGYTEKGPEVARISTLLEYEELFGKADGQSFVVTTTFDEASKSDVLDQINKQAGAEFLLYYSVALYLKNGG
ncbi:MAG: phage tail sheath family protein, partial [Pseudomonadales bacterium]|nr:phage tail sheath family protein [Pseudomonadales bacterium]